MSIKKRLSEVAVTLAAGKGCGVHTLLKVGCPGWLRVP